MHLISVNIGRSQAIKAANKSGFTGIYKLPVHQPVLVTPDGLADDVIVDTKHHGGLDQAVYVYGQLDYAWWSNVLGYELTPGTFGENLTISELESAGCSIGDRLQAGEALLEVTAPRIPCGTFAARMGDPGFAKRFRAAERPGLYCRVIHAGWVREGDVVTLAPYTGGTLSILEMFRDFYEPELNEAALRRYLSAPLAIRSRQEKEEQLRKLLGS